jgi:hypothetical protein
MRDGLKLLWSGLFLVTLLVASRASATTYYVDYTNGSDSNNGTSKSTPWKTAPGMVTNSGVSASTSLNPGDSVIFKGCVTWPNSTFSWHPKYAGTAGSPIYYGVDTSWWDNTVSSCTNGWNRPIFDAGGASIYANAHDPRMVYAGNKPYNTFDNIEFKGYYADGLGNGVTNDYVDFGGGQSAGVVVENCYFHGWTNPYFSMGTGNVAANSNTVTNYVPFSWSPAPASSWTSAPAGMPMQTLGYWPVQSNGPLATSISNTGGNSWTIVTNSSTLPNACNGCVVQIGQDYLAITGGVEGGCAGCMMINNVIDASDVNTVQYNPETDCGVASGNSKPCLGSAIAGWRLPNIWRGNVIRYVNSAFVGECSEFSNNLIEYVRLGSNPSSHTNAIECLDETPVNGLELHYGNVIRHTNNPNPNNPMGRWSIGLLNQYAPPSGSTEYIFNNVVYDTLQNAWMGPIGGRSGGTIDVFNNTSDCGPSWDLTHSCMNITTGWAAVNIVNNDMITTGTAIVGSGSYSNTNNLTVSPATANAAGYTASQVYAYSPTSAGSPTVGKGASVSSFCAAISSAGFSDAASACQKDTSYGVGYNASTHSVITPNRSTISRTSPPDIGAYQFSGAAAGSTEPPAPPTSLSVTVTTN